MKLLVIAVSVYLLSVSCNIAGGGGSTQIAPEKMGTNERAVIKLELAVWGAGGPIKGRYTDVVCYYHLVGENGYQALRADPIAKDERHEVYEFTIPPVGTTGEIEYYFEMKLDGHLSRVNGINRIRVE
jgi:hypothetical protein